MSHGLAVLLCWVLLVQGFILSGPMPVRDDGAQTIAEMAFATICHADGASAEGQTPEKHNPVEHSKACAACLACHVASVFTAPDPIVLVTSTQTSVVTLVALERGESAVSPRRASRIRGPPLSGLST